jgi:hypothetical protein
MQRIKNLGRHVSAEKKDIFLYYILASNLLIKKLSLILLILIFFWGFQAVSQLPGNEQEVERVKNTILSWFKSFESLECSYRYREDGPGLWREEEVEYRWQGNMEYYQSILLDGGGDGLEPIGSMMTESIIDGKGTLLGHQNGRVQGEKNLKGFLFSYSTNILRSLLPRKPVETTARIPPANFGLRTILAYPGTATLVEKNGIRTLIYWTQGEEMGGTSVNVTLDDRDRIIRIDYVIRPLCSPEEASQYTAKDIYSIVSKMSTLELMDYQQFNGVWFPCYIKETVYWVTDESAKRFPRLRAVQGEISWCEYYVRRMEGLEYEKDAPVSELNINPKTVRINTQLKQSDFEINIPGGTGMVDRQTNEVLFTEHETWLERHADLVIILIALGILGGITVAGWRYWLGKP